MKNKKFAILYLLLFLGTLVVEPTPLLAQTCISIDSNKPPIAAGYAHTVGIKEDGTVVAVGRNWYGELNDALLSWSDIKAVAASNALTVGLKEDGTVVTTGIWSDVSSWSNIKAIAAGYLHTVGLKEDGTVVAVGGVEGNDYGQLNVSSWTGIKAVAAGWWHTVGLKEDGTVVTTAGWSDVSSWSNIKAIAAGYDYTVGLKEDGTVVAVGDNQYGSLNVSSWSNIMAISAQNYHTVGLREDRTVVAVGYNGMGQTNVSSWSDIKAIAAGGRDTFGLKADGTVVAVGDNYYGEANISDWTNIRPPVCLEESALRRPLSFTAVDTPGDLGGSITLNWALSPDDPVSGSGSNYVTGYNIYRSESEEGPYSVLGNVTIGVSSYVDNSAVTGTTYSYRIRATDGIEESKASNAVSAQSINNLAALPEFISAQSGISAQLLNNIKGQQCNSSI